MGAACQGVSDLQLVKQRRGLVPARHVLCIVAQRLQPAQIQFLHVVHGTLVYCNASRVPSSSMTLYIVFAYY